MKKTFPVLLVLAFVALGSTACEKHDEVSSEFSSAYSSSEVISSSSALGIKKSSVTLYVATDKGTETQEENLYFIDGEGDIPFLSLNDSKTILERSFSDSSLKVEGHKVILSREETDGTITFDCDQKTVSYVAYEHYYAFHGRATSLDLVNDFGTTDDGKTRYLQSQASLGYNYVRAGKDFSISLADYQIPLYFVDGIAYIPLQTFSDLVLAGHNVYLLYNGVSIYMSGARFDSDMTTSFFAPAPKKRSEQLARYSRNELALSLSQNYGLQKEHGIEDFASYFTQLGINEKLLSTDPVAADQALVKLCSSGFADYHSAFLSPSAYAGQAALPAIKGNASLYSPNWDEYQLIRSSYVQARKAVYNALTASATTVLDAPLPYEVYGDTAYVTFDQFTNPTTDYYTTPATASSADTFGLIEYAHSQITANSAIKNVVLDLSCNSGGAINAGVYVAGWFCPDAILNMQNPLTGSQASSTYRSDINLDGVYDNNDILTSKKKLYCLVSPASFSCTNFLASVLKASDQVRLIGRKTGGGACVVQYLPSADGTLIQTSGNKMICTAQNGSFVSVDSGVAVDYSLDALQDFYNRPALTTTIDNLY
jgi:hypothetical protein